MTLSEYRSRMTRMQAQYDALKSRRDGIDRQLSELVDEAGQLRRQLLSDGGMDALVAERR